MDFSFLTDDRYHLFAAFWMTIQLTFWSAIGAMIFGTILAAMRVSPVPMLRGFGAAYVNIIRNVPLTVVIFMMYFVLFSQLGLRVASREVGVNPQSYIDTTNFRLAVIGFIVYTSTFVCESIRSGINTVPPGQAEAARAIGLRFTQVLVIVILPQAIRSVVAPLASVLIALTKNTTVAAAIGVSEAAVLMNTLIENESDKLIPVFLTIAAGFIILTLPVGLILGRVAQRMAVKR